MQQIFFDSIDELYTRVCMRGSCEGRVPVAAAVQALGIRKTLTRVQNHELEVARGKGCDVTVCGNQELAPPVSLVRRMATIATLVVWLSNRSNYITHLRYDQERTKLSA